MAASDDQDKRLKAGVKAFKAGQYAEALPLLRECAGKGSLSAQRLLSRMYYAGNGVVADRAQYYYWLLRAAENGDVAAKSKIKRRYRDGSLPVELLSDPYLIRLTGQEREQGTG